MRSARTYRPAKPDRRRTAGGAGRPGHRRRHEVNNRSAQPDGGIEFRAPRGDLQIRAAHRAAAPLNSTSCQELRDAAGQLPLTCIRAAARQSFKQVAVDRSRRAPAIQPQRVHRPDRRDLRPVLKKAAVTLSSACRKASDRRKLSRSYGQILTNASTQICCLRAGPVPGRSRCRHGPRQRRCRDHFADDRAGMTPDVQRRHSTRSLPRAATGGTGLGLHIVYNLVTQQLGGRMMLGQDWDKAPLSTSCLKSPGAYHRQKHSHWNS